MRGCAPLHIPLVRPPGATVARPRWALLQSAADWQQVPDCRPPAYEAYAAYTRPTLCPYRAALGRACGTATTCQHALTNPSAKRTCTRRAGARGRKWAPPVPVGPLLRGGPKPAKVCGPGPPGGAVLWVLPCRWAARLALFAHLPPAPGRAVSRAVGKGPCGPAGGCGAARPPLRPSLAAPPLPRFLPPGPVRRSCRLGRGAARPAVFGPGGWFPPALFPAAVVVVLRRAGGRLRARKRLRGRGLPARPPGAAFGPRFFRGARADFVGARWLLGAFPAASSGGEGSQGMGIAAPTKQGKTVQGSLFAPLGLVPCTPSFAIEA